MALPNNPIQEVEGHVKTAFQVWMDIVDSLAGGAFTTGYREASPIERIREWDNLTPEIINKLKDHKGADWVMKQGAEIERLRSKVPEFPAPPMAAQ